MQCHILATNQTSTCLAGQQKHPGFFRKGILNCKFPACFLGDNSSGSFSVFINSEIVRYLVFSSNSNNSSKYLSLASLGCASVGISSSSSHSSPIHKVFSSSLPNHTLLNSSLSSASIRLSRSNGLGNISQNARQSF
ncbi:hypothetical protein SADUNF_Sadunf04G0063800 [Salix dunnii]|uniref:Uncharacterized protein n=1 Tax=Salix dunnii TaxID=1413687 RepID=A0A835MYU6_9ROSI|nr:hypothetical protein SADUNF_Sadunf04G0063800 [Salix dunnii]